MDVAEPTPNAATPADLWRRAVESARNENPRYGKSLSFARFLSVGKGELRVAFAPDAGFHRATVMGTAKQQLEDGLARFFGRVRIVEDTSAQVIAAAPRSIAEQELTERQARSDSIESGVRTHPAVLNVLRILGGQLEHVQVLDAAPVVETPEAPVEDD
jgi:hypothetical protein